MRGISISKIIVRKYKTDDEFSLKGITGNANHNYVKNLAEYNPNNLSIAEYNGIVSGYLWLSISTGNCQAFIFVSPEYRRLGIGTALCNDAVELCRKKNEKEIWAMYYDFETKRFAEKIGCYYTTSSIYMKYTGNIILPKNEKIKNIRKCMEKDYLRCTYLWDKGYHEMQIRIGHPDSKMRKPTADDKQNFNNNIENSYVIEENGKIIGYGVISGDNIGALTVDTEMNNRGYGSALAIFMTNEILRRGNAAPYLWCESENINARHIYEKIGYKEIETCYTSFKKVI